MAISEDASTPGANTGTTGSGTLTVTSASFSPPASCLLVVIVCLGHASGTPSVAVSDSGSHAWTAGPSLGNGNTWAGIFTAPVTAAPGSITVSAENTTSQAQSMQADVRVLDGAATSQAGAGSNTASGSSTSWTGTLTTTESGSWAYLAAAGNARESVITPVSGTATLDNYQASAGTSCLSGRQSAATGTPGATTLGWSEGGSAVAFAWAALEILPAAAPAAPAGRNLVAGQAVARSFNW